MNHQPKKRFGQNFLVDEFIIQQIIKFINPQSNDNLVEIGPGLGAITLPLLQHVHQMHAIELDRDIIPLLEKKSSVVGQLTIHKEDALKFDFSKLAKERHLRIVGNLPYNISTPILFHLLEHRTHIIDMHFMLQKEVAERLHAKPGNKQYGRLTVMVQYYCEAEPLLLVPPQSFQPAPKVDSLFIRLTPKEPIIKAADLKKLDLIVKQAFSHRRKTLHNTLKGLITKEQLSKLEIDPNQRPESLTVENFVRISNILKDTSRN